MMPTKDNEVNWMSLKFSTTTSQQKSGEVPAVEWSFLLRWQNSRNNRVLPVAPTVSTGLAIPGTAATRVWNDQMSLEIAGTSAERPFECRWCDSNIPACFNATTITNKQTNKQKTPR
jgi:hypothetical protein